MAQRIKSVKQETLATYITLHYTHKLHIQFSLTYLSLETSLQGPFHESPKKIAHPESQIKICVLLWSCFTLPFYF